MDETTSFMDKLTNMIAYGTYGGDDQIGVNQRFKAEAGAANYFNDAEAGARLAEQVRYMSSSSDGEAASIVKDFNKDTRSQTDARLAALAKSGFDIQGSGLVNSVATMRKADKMAKEMKREQQMKTLYASTYNGGYKGPGVPGIGKGNDYLTTGKNGSLLAISIPMDDGMGYKDGGAYDLEDLPVPMLSLNDRVNGVFASNIDSVRGFFNSIAEKIGELPFSQSEKNSETMKWVINSVANYASEVNSVIDYSNISDLLQYFKDNQDFVKGTASMSLS